MKERQRWQPEEDALLIAYVKQYGPKEWNLISQRMSQPINRDPKSCLERWKNYLKPGIKKGSLTPEEQSLVISLQAKYGNKWKKIASEVPGRTAKRLGKWWEVFKEKQFKLNNSDHNHRHQQQWQQERSEDNYTNGVVVPGVGDVVRQGRYDHILETFAEKYVQPNLLNLQSCSSFSLMPDPDPVLSLGSVWMNSTASSSLSSSTTTTTTTTSVSASPMSLTLSPSDPEANRFTQPGQNVGVLVQYCKELEEGRQSWMQHKKEATWRLSRLEQQLESEKARKRKEKTEETEAKIRCLREEEMAFMSRIESDYREQLSALQRDAESKEGKLMEAWCSKHSKLAKLVEQIGIHGASSGGVGVGGFNVAKDHLH